MTHATGETAQGTVPDAGTGIHDLIVIGASAGGIAPLRAIVRDLPRRLGAAVLVVLHVSPEHPSALPGILERAGSIPAAHATDGEPITAGTIRVAPPGRHLVVADGRLALSRAPEQNNHRPAIDPLFVSAAATYGSRVVGVVLSGMLDDGAAGLAAVAAAGGVTVVQDPADASYASMPEHAIAAVAPDHVVPVEAIAPLLIELSEDAPEPAPGVPAWVADAARAVVPGRRAPSAAEPAGVVSSQTCPSCGGTLWEQHDDGPLRYRCRVGHAWSAASLFARSAEHVEEALWVALRSLEERAALALRLADDAASGGSPLSAGQFREQAEDAERRARVVREALAETGGGDALDRTPEEGEA